MRGGQPSNWSQLSRPIVALAAELLLDELDRGSAGGAAQVFVLGDEEGRGHTFFVDAGVEADDGDAGFLGLLAAQPRSRRPRWA